MIQSEILSEGRLIRHWSDEGFYIIQTDTGVKYSEAVDVNPTEHTYEETDEPIETAKEDGE